MWLFGWLLGGGQFLAPWNQEQVYLSFESPLHWMGVEQTDLHIHLNAGGIARVHYHELCSRLTLHMTKTHD